MLNALESFWRILEFRMPWAVLLSVLKGDPEFFECSVHGPGMFAANVDTTGFGLSCRGHNVLDCLAEDVNGSIGAVAV